VPRATMDKITFGADLPGYEAGPKEGPAVVVLQEWWGEWLNEIETVSPRPQPVHYDGQQQRILVRVSYVLQYDSCSPVATKQSNMFNCVHDEQSWHCCGLYCLSRWQAATTVPIVP
jgi:hypothetical protein